MPRAAAGACLALFALAGAGCAALEGEFEDFELFADEQMAAKPDSAILVIGDSVMWWNSPSGASVGDVLADALGEDVVNLSVPGARIRNDDPAARTAGLDIPSQYRARDWDWVVVEGGANDFDDCGCNRCDAVLDELISRDGARGEIPSLVNRIRADGARVAAIGYYQPPAENGDLTECGDELAELSSRIETMSGSIEGVVFASMADVVDPNDPADYDPDLIHPSAKASGAVGRLIAETISDAGR